MLSTCWLIGTYFLAVSSHKLARGRLNTSVYGKCIYDREETEFTIVCDCSEGDVEVEASSSMPSLADQFEQIKHCRYIRHSPHYQPEAAAIDSDN